MVNHSFVFGGPAFIPDPEQLAKRFGLDPDVVRAKLAPQALESYMKMKAAEARYAESKAAPTIPTTKPTTKPQPPRVYISKEGIGVAATYGEVTRKYGQRPYKILPGAFQDCLGRFPVLLDTHSVNQAQSVADLDNEFLISDCGELRPSSEQVLFTCRLLNSQASRSILSEHNLQCSIAFDALDTRTEIIQAYPSGPREEIDVFAKAHLHHVCVTLVTTPCAKLTSFQIYPLFERRN